MRIFSIAALSVMLFWTAALPAQTRRSSGQKTASAPIDNILVATHFLPAPEIQVQDKPSSSLPIGKAKKWLMFQISYQFSSAAASAKKIYEDMRVELYLRNPAPGGEAAWFTGRQMLHCVIADREKHYVALFIPPTTISRFISQDTRYKNIVKDLEGIVLFYDRNNKLLGRTIFDHTQKGPSKSRMQALWNAMKNIQQAKYKFIDSVWPKENTPWQWVDADKYDIPKPVFNGSRSTSMQKEPEGESEK